MVLCYLQVRFYSLSCICSRWLWESQKETEAGRGYIRPSDRRWRGLSIKKKKNVCFTFIQCLSLYSDIKRLNIRIRPLHSRHTCCNSSFTASSGQCIKNNFRYVAANCLTCWHFLRIKSIFLIFAKILISLFRQHDLTLLTRKHKSMILEAVYNLSHI